VGVIVLRLERSDAVLDDEVTPVVIEMVAEVGHGGERGMDVAVDDRARHGLRLRREGLLYDLQASRHVIPNWPAGAGIPVRDLGRLRRLGWAGFHLRCRGRGRHGPLKSGHHCARPEFECLDRP
jgi:hypothetical protein